MTDRLVLDASAALAYLRNEARRDTIAGALTSHLSHGGIVIVPDVFWLEVINVLVRRHALPLEVVLEAVRELDEIGLQTITSTRAAAMLGLDLMIAHRLSAYDAAYLALAEIEDARLLTLDTHLEQAAGDRSAIERPRGLHEAQAPYVASAPVGALAAHGAYLAELRRQAEAGLLR